MAKITRINLKQIEKIKSLNATKINSIVKWDYKNYKIASKEIAKICVNNFDLYIQAAKSMKDKTFQYFQKLEEIL